MIEINVIKDDTLETLIKIFDESIDYLKSQFGIELKTYGNFLRIVLSNIQSDALNNLVERVKVNRELERALENEGGYTIDFLGESNPKAKLIELINYLKSNSQKCIKLKNYIVKNNEKKTIVADTNDIDYITQFTHNYRIKVISLAELKRNISDYDNLIFYSFNGKKDFDFIYNLQRKVSLVLYEQECQLYERQLQNRKHLITWV